VIRILVLLTALLAAAPAQALMAPPEPAKDTLTIARPADGKTWDIAVEIAATPAAREHGLMNRRIVPQGTGMLFVYDRPQPVNMWMRNTLVPLDMLFFDPSGRIVFIHERAIPGDETAIGPSQPVCGALEIGGSEVERLGIRIGDVIRTKQLAACMAAAVSPVQQ